MSDAPVQVNGLTKVFYDEGRGEVLAVDGVDFECRRGEILGLLGANGAGKTTTLRMLSTVLAPTAGSARVMQFDVRENPSEVRRNIGFHSSSTALYPRLTTRETLEFFARINHYPPEKIPARVDELVARFGLEKYASARIDKLSSGMKQKVSIARTIAHAPPVLIFDEPTVALDVINALEMRDIIAELRDKGKAIIFSTHIMSEAEKLCDRIAIIHAGKILACDSLEQLQASTGLRYLEDIFIQFVRQGEAGAARAGESSDAGPDGAQADGV